MLYVLIWVVFGLGLGVLSGLAARAVCRHRRMFQLGDRAFWVCLVCGIFNLHVLAALAFCIVAYVRDHDVGLTYGSPARSGESAGGYVISSTLRLVCVSGPLTGQSYALGPGVLGIGTDPSNMIRLPLGTPGVSRRHCCVRWQNSAPQLVDLGSSYGTFLDGGRKLPPQNPAELRIGSSFYLGSAGCMFQVIAN